VAENTCFSRDFSGYRPSFNLAVVEGSPRCLIHNKKMSRVKFKKNMVISGKAMN
jgi:hypothetical protein